MGRIHTRLNNRTPSFLSRKLFSYLLKAETAPDHGTYELHRFANGWDSTVRKMLKKMARAKWSKRSWPGIFPRFDTRIRKKSSHEKVTWWVEHDIPPSDLFKCEAYFVELELDESLLYTLGVRSGSEKYSVDWPWAAFLEAVLVEAAQDPPVIISRRMGSAIE